MSTNLSAAPKKASAALFNRLSGLLGDIAPTTNKNDQVTALIAACIAEEFADKKSIIGIVSHFGFKPYHVTQMLEYGTGNEPASGHWRRNQDGTFSLFA